MKTIIEIEQDKITMTTTGKNVIKEHKQLFSHNPKVIGRLIAIMYRKQKRLAKCDHLINEGKAYCRVYKGTCKCK